MQGHSVTSTAAPAVRLGPRDRAALEAAFRQVLAPLGRVRVYLFGSRARPGDRGGDIDLLVRLDRVPSEPLTALTRRLRLAVFSGTDEQKLDVVWDLPGSDTPIAALACLDAVEIWKTEDPS